MPAREIHPIIRQVIDRDCPVGESGRAVVRHVISKLKHGYDTFRIMPKLERRKFIEQCLSQHAANRRLYAEVMNGFSSTRKLEQELLDQVEALLGLELSELAREHNKSQSYLAFRLGWSNSRVRLAFQQGLVDRRVICEWLRAIAEIDTNDVPEKYRVRDKLQSADCNFCGCPLICGDMAFEYRQNDYCSNYCCRKSRGW